jgi:hypothetical protein
VLLDPEGRELVRAKRYGYVATGPLFIALPKNPPEPADAIASAELATEKDENT